MIFFLHTEPIGKNILQMFQFSIPPVSSQKSIALMCMIIYIEIICTNI